MVRSGDEPSHARSPLGFRLGLALFGVLSGVAAAVVLAAAGHPGVAALFAVVALVALLDAAVVGVRIRQGPHFQPGADVPPYRPAAPPAAAQEPRPAVPQRVRKREYLLLMGTCLGLLVLAWVVLRPFSTDAAVAVTVVAMVIPPIAAIVANRS